ncbi:MAG TPA: hypothetical protein V6D12_13595 [Candidatus Obscuribacterales bacterium]
MKTIRTEISWRHLTWYWQLEEITQIRKLENRRVVTCVTLTSRRNSYESYRFSGLGIDYETLQKIDRLKLDRILDAIAAELFCTGERVLPSQTLWDYHEYLLKVDSSTKQ